MHRKGFNQSKTLILHISRLLRACAHAYMTLKIKSHNGGINFANLVYFFKVIIPCVLFERYEKQIIN
jgi:hypothetical protein